MEPLEQKGLNFGLNWLSKNIGLISLWLGSKPMLFDLHTLLSLGLIPSETSTYKKLTTISNFNIETAGLPYIGLLVSGLYSDYEDPAAALFKEFFNEQGFQTMICEHRENPLLFLMKIQQLQCLGCRGIIVLPAAAGRLYKSLRIDHILDKPECPVVSIDRRINCDQGIPSVVSEQEVGIYDMVRALLNEGYQRFAFVGGSSRLEVAIRRENGFRQAVELNPKISSSTFHLNVPSLDGKQRWDDDSELTRLKNYIRDCDIFEGHAFVCFNDDSGKLTKELLIEELGRVPKNWALTHFDGLKNTGLIDEPYLTIGCQQNVEEIILEACELLWLRINNKSKRYENILIPTKLEIVYPKA